jgi:integrase
VDRRGFNTSLQDAAARGGVVTTSRQRITPHSLRDTFATHALAAGSIKAVQHALGHATAAMTLDRYAGLLPEDTEALRTGLVAAEKASRKRSK